MYQLEKIKELASTLRAESAIAEKDGKLTDRQLDLLYEYKLFKLFVPETFGGLALTLLDGLLIEEELATVDGSLGWTVTLCAGANMFVGYLDPKITDSLFRDKRACLGGSGKVAGIAEINKGGYLITGKWDYATGAPHNTAFTANCILQQEGELVLDAQGKPVSKSFVFLRNEVDIIENSWNTMGLKATAGSTFAVEKLFVDKNRSFEINPNRAFLTDVIYHYPFQQLAETTIAVNTLGMGRHFLMCCKEILQQRYPKPSHQIPWEIYQRATKQIQELRNQFFSLVDVSWQQMHSYHALHSETARKLSGISKQLVRTVQQQVTLLYPYCGMNGARVDQEINRIWRDLFTASQHNLLVDF